MLGLLAMAAAGPLAVDSFTLPDGAERVDVVTDASSWVTLRDRTFVALRDDGTTRRVADPCGGTGWMLAVSPDDRWVLAWCDDPSAASPTVLVDALTGKAVVRSAERLSAAWFSRDGRRLLARPTGEPLETPRFRVLDRATLAPIGEPLDLGDVGDADILTVSDGWAAMKDRTITVVGTSGKVTRSHTVGADDDPSAGLRSRPCAFDGGRALAWIRTGRIGPNQAHATAFEVVDALTFRTRASHLVDVLEVACGGSHAITLGAATDNGTPLEAWDARGARTGATGTLTDRSAESAGSYPRAGGRAAVVSGIGAGVRVRVR